MTGISRSAAIKHERKRDIMKNYFGDSGRYDDIIDLPHHVSPTRPRMPARDRAAQFAPFAALTGYGDAVKETARITEERREPDGEQTEILNRTVKILAEKIREQPEITVVFFCPDERKEGGSYRQFRGNLRRIDECRRRMIFTDGNEISFDNIREIRYDSEE